MGERKIVVWKFIDEVKEHTKKCSSFIEAMKFQRNLLKKHKEKLEFAIYK